MVSQNICIQRDMYPYLYIYMYIYLYLSIYIYIHRSRRLFADYAQCKRARGIHGELHIYREVHIELCLCRSLYISDLSVPIYPSIYTYKGRADYLRTMRNANEREASMVSYIYIERYIQRYVCADLYIYMYLSVPIYPYIYTYTGRADYLRTMRNANEREASMVSYIYIERYIQRYVCADLYIYPIYLYLSIHLYIHIRAAPTICGRYAMQTSGRRRW